MGEKEKTILRKSPDKIVNENVANTLSDSGKIMPDTFLITNFQRYASISNKKKKNMLSNHPEMVGWTTSVSDLSIELGTDLHKEVSKIIGRFSRTHKTENQLTLGYLRSFSLEELTTSMGDENQAAFLKEVFGDTKNPVDVAQPTQLTRRQQNKNLEL